MKTCRGKLALALAYTGLIYASLPFTRTPLRMLRRAAGETALNAGVNIFLVAAFFGIFFFVLKGKHRFRQAFVFLAVSFIFALFIKRLNLPEERIHFLEYGLCGVLYMNAFESGETLSPGRKIFWAFAAAALAGIIDELIQKILPSRVFDLRDILFNVVAGAGGVVIKKWALNLNSIK